MTQLINTWSKDPSEEDSMTDEHAWIWREMIDCIPHADLSQAKVLDIGCNQGGFLRMLYDTQPFAEGVGVDLAQDRIALADAAKGARPLSYLATDTLADAGTGFDLAFSHEVIYLIEDLEDHARQVAAVLKPGGTYDAITCCHADSPLWAGWRPKIAAFSNIPVPNHSVADIAAAFRAAGLDLSISRFLARAFIPNEPPSDYFPSDLARLETYCTWKLCFRARRPA
ncbi:bifunctional 2-polyprenyl-6-hydroxyphenol methylase/3-demethylubiquinol 3-O-methyltransferase UbiG [uncultured Roseobacter sp.]|uniref:class I SAM-dependent methyltransferase n=1 Tax=uncultured Roseobacter sp. TaxID=114847 RepID=UPI00261DE2AD|nr:class I SAM-dependent methyltransferase [uncultured Roseobacter sp.]